MTWFRKRPVALTISAIIVIIAFIIMTVRDEGINNASVTQPVEVIEYTITVTEGAYTEATPATREAVDPLPRTDGYLPLGSTFDFDNLRITLGNTIGWTDVDASWSDLNRETVFYIPITVTNNYSSSHRLQGWLVTMFGPDGLRLDEVDWYFDNDVLNGRNDMRPGATLHSYLHILYDGDGEYVIEFSDWDETVEIIFQVRR